MKIRDKSNGKIYDLNKYYGDVNLWNINEVEIHINIDNLEILEK